MVPKMCSKKEFYQNCEHNGQSYFLFKNRKLATVLTILDRLTQNFGGSIGYHLSCFKR